MTTAPNRDTRKCETHFDFYAHYAEWHAKFYGRPFNVTREEWNAWCRQPHRVAYVSDIEFDYAKEREGDAQ